MTREREAEKANYTNSSKPNGEGEIEVMEAEIVTDSPTWVASGESTDCVGVFCMEASSSDLCFSVVVNGGGLR